MKNVNLNLRKGHGAKVASQTNESGKCLLQKPIVKLDQMAEVNLNGVHRRLPIFLVNASQQEASMEELERTFHSNPGSAIQIEDAGFNYVEKIWKHFTNEDYFRFAWNIGSCNRKTLEFWQPDNPSFKERRRALKLANALDFHTLVFCSPPLDGDLVELVELVSPFADHVIIEIPHSVEEFLTEYGCDDPLKVAKAKEILKLQSTDWLLEVGAKLRENPVPWWDERTRTFLDQHFPDIEAQPYHLSDPWSFEFDDQGFLRMRKWLDPYRWTVISEPRKNDQRSELPKAIEGIRRHSHGIPKLARLKISQD